MLSPEHALFADTGNRILPVIRQPGKTFDAGNNSGEGHGDNNAGSWQPIHQVPSLTAVPSNQEAGQP
jgi:hypothetical protein